MVGDAVWGEIGRGLFGCRASGVDPAVEERQPEPTAVVAGGDRRRDGSLRSGQDRRPGPPDAAGLGSSLQRIGSGGPRRQLDGPKPRLSAEQLAQFAQIVEAGPDREKDGVVVLASARPQARHRRKVRRRVSRALCRKASEEAWVLSYERAPAPCSE